MLDSQPEVVATPPQTAGNPETPARHTESIANISFITDSNAAESQSSMEQDQSGSQEEAKEPLTRLKAALVALESADLGSKELRETEDEVFEVYLRLREQRRRRDKE